MGRLSFSPTSVRSFRTTSTHRIRLFVNVHDGRGNLPHSRIKHETGSSGHREWGHVQCLIDIQKFAIRDSSLCPLAAFGSPFCLVLLPLSSPVFAPVLPPVLVSLLPRRVCSRHKPLATCRPHLALGALAMYLYLYLLFCLSLCFSL